MAMIFCFSFMMLLIFVSRTKVREALFAIAVAVLFTWPITLIFTQVGLQSFPVRLFPHATEGSFLFGFVLFPSLFTIYCLNYPKEAGLLRRLSYSLLFSAFPVLIQFLLGTFTNLADYPTEWIYIITPLLVIIIFNICRKYIQWYFDKGIVGIRL